MNNKIDPCDTMRVNLIAAAVGLQQCTKTAANIIPIPGGDRVIAIGTPAQVRGLLAADVDSPPLTGAELDKQRELFEQSEPGLHLGRNAAGDYENKFVQCGWLGWQAALIAQARAQQASATAIEHAVFLRQASTFGPWIECAPSHKDAVRFVRPVFAQQSSQPPAPVVAAGFEWPKPPQRKGQSNVLFDDGYEEGWAKAIDTVRALLDVAPPAPVCHAQASATGCGGTGDFIGGMPCPGCDACPDRAPDAAPREERRRVPGGGME
jgi:hypothetical protein